MKDISEVVLVFNCRIEPHFDVFSENIIKIGFYSIL